MTRKEYTDSLRMIADFYDQHEEVSLPYKHEVFEDFHEENLGPLARAFGDGAKKEYDKDFEGSFALVKQFGSIEFRLVAIRASVCKKRVVGTRHIERSVVPERIIEAHDEEIIEWDCSESLLAGDSEL